MPITAHVYRHPQDFARLVRFLSQVRTDVQHTHSLHVGDLTWQMFHMLSDYPPADLVRIWEDTHGDMRGFVLLFPPFGGFEAQLRPQDRGTALEAELLGWAEQHLPATPRHSTLVNNHDTTRLTLLTDLGYVPQGEWLYVEQRLTNVLPHPRVPPGFSIRSVYGDREAQARAVVVAAAFDAPPHPERYQRLIQASGYVRDLDIVAVVPDQRFAAFAMCWVDQANRVGQFEPVGTAPDFRRRGVTRAVLSEGLRRMQAHGAERVIVIVEAAEKVARALYASVGFREQWGLTWYTKDTSAWPRQDLASDHARAS
jgi:ribosomal protein S18 acetylase RimI-like enzyme